MACDDAWDMWIGSSGGLQLINVIAEYTLDYTSTLKNVIMASGVRYTYGLQKVGSSDGRYYHQDRLGSVVAVTNNSGAVTGEVEYDDWGVPEVVKGGVAPEYTGHMWDDVLGMWYARARMYSSENRRFCAVDPVKGKQKEPLSFGQYLYCVDNPIGLVDPSGKIAIDVWTAYNNQLVGSGEDDADFETRSDDVEYNSKDKAAKGFISEWNIKSIVNHWEYFAYIYKTPSRSKNSRYTYNYSPPKTDKQPNQVSYEMKKKYGNSLIVAIIHTHPYINTENYKGDGENFSSADKEGAIKYHEFSSSFDAVYVCTPKGKLKKYTPSTKEVSTVASGYAHDPAAMDGLFKHKDCDLCAYKRYIR